MELGRQPTGSLRHSLRETLAFSADVIQVCSLGIVAAAAAALLGKFGLFAVIAAGVAGGVIAVLGSALILQRQMSSLAFRRGYRWRRATLTYSIDPRDPALHVCTVEVELEAVRTGVSLFEDRFAWTGTGPDDHFRVLQPVGAQVLGPVRRGAWGVYYVPLGKELAPRETATVQVRQELRDTGGTFQPYFAKTVAEEIEDLSLVVRTPYVGVPIRARATEQSSGGPEAATLRTLAPHFDIESGEIRLSVGRATKGHRYEVAWEPPPATREAPVRLVTG